MFLRLRYVLSTYAGRLLALGRSLLAARRKGGRAEAPVCAHCLDLGVFIGSPEADEVRSGPIDQDGWIRRPLRMQWVDFGLSPSSEIRLRDVDRLNRRLRHRVTTVASWGVLRTGRATGVSRNQSTSTMHAIDTRPSIPNVSAHAIT